MYPIRAPTVREGLPHTRLQFVRLERAHGLNLPLGDLTIGATAVELGYAVDTSNLRDFNRIPGLRVVHL